MSIVWHTCPECKDKHLGRNLIGPSPDGTCGDCHSAQNPAEFDASHAIRCPKCAHVERDEFGEMGLYEEGLHAVDCGECGSEYEVSVSISFTYTSPAMATGECP